MVIFLIATAFWAIPPTYVPSNAAVLVSGDRPIDDGRAWGGRRVLRDDKTWRGTTTGTLIGTLPAVVLNATTPATLGAFGVSPPTFPLAARFGFALGMMLGDIDVSSIKCRSGRRRGAVFPGPDQPDFVANAPVLTFVITSGWLAVTSSLSILTIILVAMSVLYVVTSVSVCLLRLKNEPW